MARRSQCSSAGDNPLDPNYLPPHYREEYRLAIDALVEEDLEGYYKFLQRADVVDFLSTPEIQYIQSSVQVPQQGHHPEQHFLETGGDGSSDTYWPIHSDLDVPGLDLGWPQLHHFIGPTEVTTLVNPPEPDMPSIKEQARRLIRNAQQVIAVVMDMFTDVDIFAEILNAAMRSVAVYILLDEHNADHFINMVSNCRVNLQSIQFLRVRTVSGITYHCRSGTSFKGQMMDRFLLTDCRAVLSGNYSFMWSFEKLHRCMAHLFLGQLVSTFDEEFRILFAQSRPLLIAFDPLEDFGLSQKTQYPSDRTTLFRDTRKFLSVETGHPEERVRHPYNERMDVDWRMMPLKRQESLHGPSDMYSRFPSQQARMDPSFDQLPSRISIMENPAFKHHSYAEGGHGRFSYPFLQQQGMPEPDNQGRHFLRGQLPYPYPGPGPEADYGGYDKLWSQDCPSADQYSEPGLPQEMQPPDNFNPVLNYLSSTRNVDFDQSSEKLLPTADLPFSSSHPRRLSLGQPYACQTSPTPSAPADQKTFFQDLSTDRKDPTVKRGLRNWRISSYLSAYDNPGDEGLPLAPPQAQDHFEEPLHRTQQTAPGIDLPVPKIPNVREFKIPAVPRASQMPGYAKTTVQEQPKKLLDEPAAVATETKTTPTPSESSSTAEGDKVEEAEQKEPKTTVLRREESFRRKYNAAVPRSSRLRSSLIFSSLDQQNASQDAKTAPVQQDEESDKNEAEPTKLPFVAQVLAQRRSAAREPFEWSRYIKSATETSKPDDGSSKADDKDPSKEENSKDLSENLGVEGSFKPPGVEQTNSSPSLPRSKPCEAEQPKTDTSTIQAPKPLLNTPSYVDMSDPDKRLMFFKELAAKRKAAKAAKAAEAEKSKDKAQMKPPTVLKNNTAVKKEEPDPKEVSEKMVDTSLSEGLSEKNVTADVAGKTVSTEASESTSLSLEASDKTNKQDSLAKNDPSTSQSCKEEQTRVSEKKELKTSQSETSLPVSAETESQTVQPPGDLNLSKPAVKERSPSHPPSPTNAPPDNVPSPAQGTDESESPNHDSTSKDSSSLTSSSVEVPLSSLGPLDSNTQIPESAQLETRISEPAPSSEQQTGSDLSSSNTLVQGSSPDQILSDCGSQISPSPTSPTSSSVPLSTPGETLTSNVTPEDSSPSCSILSPDSDKPEAQDSVSPSSPESSQATNETSAESESAQAHLDQLTSSETSSAADSAHVESIISPDTCGASAESNASSLQTTTKTNSEEPCAPTPSEKDVSESENNSVPEAVSEESEVLGSSKDVKADSTPPCLSPSSPKSGLADVSDLESSASRPDQTETVDLHASPEHTPSETCSPLSPDVTPNSLQSATTASPQDTLTQATPPSELNLTGSVTLTPVETVSCSSPLTESVESVLSLEAEKTETNMSTLCIPSDAPSPPEEITTDETPVLPSTEASSPTEPTSKIPTEPDLPCKTPESVTSESHPSEPPVPAKNSNIDHQTEASKEPELLDPAEKKLEDTEATNKVNKSTTQESVRSEKTNDLVRQNSCSESAEITSDDVVPLSPQSKQPKSSQSRYHSSTANVLSSSNLRDDTKLLLEQISAHSQSRNEATKESPVTDDEKEDKADKNAKREKERGMRTLGRVQPKSTQEKEKLLERIQSMRKEKKVYSRFEMAP